MAEQPEKWTLSDLVALSALQPLCRGYVPWTAWSMRPAAVASVVNEIVRGHRRAAVELGAGTSTLFLGHALRLTGGRLTAVEHDGEHADHVRGLVAGEGLGDVVAVEVVPLARWTATAGEAGESFGEGAAWQAPHTWYDADRLRTVCPPGIDVLVVDGPPAGMYPDTLVREPAVQVLGPLLAADYAIFLDDADRPAERETLRRWSASLGLDLRPVERIGLGAGRSGDGYLPTM
jgi:hypothetical protein